MNSSPPYDLVIGLDRSDRIADLHLIDPRTGQRRAATIDTAPEALWEWLLQLRQQHPQARVGLCLEQPAVAQVVKLLIAVYLALGITMTGQRRSWECGLPTPKEPSSGCMC
jgi:hypothetical protein